MAAVQNGKVGVQVFSLLVFVSHVWRAGFVAIVNKELSAKYETLVNDAPELIKELPWGKEFEVDVFKKPDFTALEIVSFCTGGDKNNFDFN